MPRRTRLGNLAGLLRQRRPAGLAYQPALDGLRGVAVLAVLFFHDGHLQGGFLGVDLFFTVSGYLITSLLLAERAATERIDLAAFWARRARRLLPALYVLVATVVLVYAAWGRPGEAEALRDHGLAAVFYVANWYSIATGGYWDLFSAPSPFEHLWSLAIEEQFYVVWPLVAVLVLRRARRGDRALLAVAASGAAVSALLMAAFARSDVERAYLGTDTRVASILVGAVAAVLLRQPVRPLRGSAAVAVAAWVAVAGLGVTWARIDGSSASTLYRGGFLLHAIAVAVVIVEVTTRPRHVLGRVLSWRPAVIIGLASYSLYLWHWPVFVWLTPARTGLSGWTLTALRFAVAGALAAASYLLLEHPIRHRVRGVRTVAVGGIASAGALVAALLFVGQPRSGPGVTVAALAPTGTAAATSVPVTSTPNHTVLTTPSTSRPIAASTAPATKLAPAVSTLVRTHPAVPPALRRPTAEDPLRVVLVGDSYMFDAAPGIEAALESTGMARVEDHSTLGFAITRDGADGQLRAVIEEQPDLVITMWARFDIVWMAENDSAAFASRLDAATRLLVESGAHVVVVGLAPSVEGLLDPHPVPREINGLFARLPDAFPGQVTYLDPDPVVAPSGEATRSIAVPGGELRVRKPDLSHFCPDGAARFGQALVELLAVSAAVPPPTAPWYAGPWRQDPRYDDPPGACR
jgi:peptidoglycan/LPS O-acetylase OafA/YrhL